MALGEGAVFYGSVRHLSTVVLAKPAHQQWIVEATRLDGLHTLQVLPVRTVLRACCAYLARLWSGVFCRSIVHRRRQRSVSGDS